jgi:outer membrane lipoprotein-sorting protein
MRLAGVFLLGICCILLISQAAGAQEKASSELDRVYRQMQGVQKVFRSFSAKITRKKYTAILKEFGETETGEFYIARAKDGLRIRQEISSPGKEILTVKGNLLTLYRPSIKQAQVSILSNENKSKIEFLSLGLGSSPDELKKDFDVSYQGEESVGGVPCSVLLLKPKDRKIASTYTRIVIWIKKSSGIPIQNRLQEPNNDYLQMTFSDEKLNPKIPDSKFEQKKIPKDVETLRY